MRISIITGNEKRHRYFAAELSRHLDTSVVIFEKKANKHEDLFDESEDGRLLKKHFELRGKSEEQYFSLIPELVCSKTIETETGAANDDEIYNLLTTSGTGILLLFGSSIIGEKLLEHFKDKVINLHLGLSPYYRGSGTNFWPYVYNEPECIGSTIHVATSKVDGGAILKQIRPDMNTNDSMHDIGNNVIVKSVQALPRLIRLYCEGERIAQKQPDTKGRLCKRNDLTPQAIRTAYYNFEQGLIPQYLQHKEQRDAGFPIIN